MIRVNVVVEGPTEVLFVHEALSPHLAEFGVFVRAMPVFTSNKPGMVHRGGATYYSRIHQEISRWCKQDSTANVTSMFDLYALPEDFPGRQRARREKTKYNEISVLEQAFGESIGCRNFIPYLQLHEFEALLFSDIQRLAKLYPGRAEAISALAADTADFAPEEIDDRPEFAPSKRIVQAVPAYNKKLAGVITALDIGLQGIRSRCKHFDEGLAKLESLGQPAG